MDKEGGSEFIPEIPRIMYEVFGRRMSQVAGRFFGDLNTLFNEYVILQASKITDPATDARNNDNLSVDFLIAHYNLATDPAIGQRLASINSELQAFRKKILPARHKFISYHDRNAILAGNALGAASNCEWDEFRSGLQEIISIIHEKSSALTLTFSM